MSNSPHLKSTFFRHLKAHNRPHLDNFNQWLFQPGMLFNSLEKWWGNNGARPAPHEGLDLCSFAEVHGDIKTLGRHTWIPAAFAGEIVKIAPDFLGQSIYLRHAIFDHHGRQLVSIYGHTIPLESLQVGSQVSEGEVIAVISKPSGQKFEVLPHVHITLAWVPRSLGNQELDWKNLRKHPGLELIDPLPVLGLDSA